MSILRSAGIAAVTGALIGALVSEPMWQVRDIYARRRAGAEAGDASLLLGMPVVLIVGPAVFALHRSGSGPDPQFPEGLTDLETTALAVISIAGNWVVWAVVGALIVNRFSRRTD